jgi:hypothetical protein
MWGFLDPTDADAATEAARKKEAFTMSMSEEHHHHEESTPMRDPEGSGGLVGYAAIKYIAIVAIVLAILVFLALYLIPALT